MKKNLFVDRALITIVAGKGGNGSSHFHREKFVPLGGPDGGDGGKGGDVIFQVEPGLKTLIDFSYKQTYQAEPGQPGRGKKMYGRQGQDCIVIVPQGTLVFTRTGELLADLNEPHQTFIAAHGGRGGRGNVHFATALKRAPKLAEKGEPGEEKELILELKLLADVGLIGLPNAGKSTLLKSVSAANPKIANYPFTTLTPNLGRVKIDTGASFVMVDIPGLIAGASQGQGLGHEFLRHVERNRLLIHVIDVGFPEVHPIEDFKVINRELQAYNAQLLKRPQLVALNKIDLVQDENYLNEIKDYFRRQQIAIYPISAATGQGVQALMQAGFECLKKMPPAPLYQPAAKPAKQEQAPRFLIIPLEANQWQVKGKEVEKWVAMTDFENDEAVKKLKNIFDRIGLTQGFKDQQVKNGDYIVVGKQEFVYQED